MTRKKRQRKEQHRGSPPPSVLESYNPAFLAPSNPDPWDDLALDDPGWDDDADPIGEAGAYDTDLRMLERPLLRIRHYLERSGIELSPDNADEIERSVQSGAWVDEPVPEPTTPLERAQSLMYDAFETADPSERIRLAKKARQISRDCADAWVVLAEEESASPQEAKRLYQDGIKAGERATRDIDFEAAAGHSWVLLLARPYLRAIAGLAGVHWYLGELGPAIERYARLIELDPNDYQQVRASYVSCLLEAGRDAETLRVLDLSQFADDESAMWVHSRALALFRHEGDSEAAAEALRQAMGLHPLVAAYLLGIERISANLLIDPDPTGESAQAASYFVADIVYWLRTPSAIDWVREHADEKALRKHRTQHPTAGLFQWS
jgi:tetratricopeptide (TPR) repeat protein